MLRLLAVFPNAGPPNAGRIFTALALALLALAIMALSIRQGAQHTLVLSATVGGDGPVQVFFDTGTGFSESLSTTVAAREGLQLLEFDVPSGELSSVRIDPAAQTNTLHLSEAKLVSATEDTNLLAGAQATYSNGVDVAVSGEGFTFSFGEENADPFVALTLKQPVTMVSGKSGPWGLLLASAVLALAAVSLYRVPAVARLLPAFIAGSIATLAVTMALLSPLDRSHPDEQLHVADASYFKDNWLPPNLDSEGLARSLDASPFGVSYLFEWNAVYFLAAKYAAFLEIFGLDFETGLRLFGITLFVGILAVMARVRADPLYLGLLFIIPQTWYVFSYFNGDSFPLLISFIAVVLGTQKDGPVERFLSGSAKLSLIVVLFAAFVGLLIISKKNYYFVPIFILAWQLIRMIQLPRSVLCSGIFLMGVLFIAVGFPGLPQTVSPWLAALIVAAGALVALLIIGRFLFTTLRSSPERRAILKRGAVLYVLAFCIALPWIGIDMARNGFGDHKADTIQQLMEANAAPEFRPTTLRQTPELSFPGLRLADKGVPFEALASEPYSWLDISFRSFYAAFGNMEFFSADENYAVFGLLLTLLLLAGIVSRMRADADWDKYLFLALSLSAIVVFASYAHSWTYDFQPQGRYLFSLIPIASPFLLVAATQPKLRMIAQALVLVGFVSSATLFMTMGLGNLD